MISGLFDHTEDRSEPSGATLSFLPLLPAMGMFTHKFHPSFRSMLTVFKTGHLLLFEYWATFTSGFCYTRISPLHYSTACFGVSAKFAFTSLQKVSRIFLAFRASVYYRCQNPSCLNRHQEPHIPFCVAFWAPCIPFTRKAEPHCCSIPQAAWSQIPVFSEGLIAP